MKTDQIPTGRRWTRKSLMTARVAVARFTVALAAVTVAAIALAAITPPGVAAAQEPAPAHVEIADPPAAYRALRDVSLDGRGLDIDGVTLDRDAFRIVLSGTLHPLAPIGGRAPGVVFSGDGRLTVVPRTPVERRHLAVRTGTADPLEERFERAIFLLDDEGVAALVDSRAAGPGEADPGKADPGTADAGVRESGKSLIDHAASEGMDIALRWLRARINGRSSFFAMIDGARLGRALVAIDPDGVLDGEEACLRVTEGDDPGYWYASGSPSPTSPIDVEHYDIASTVKKGTDFAATVDVRFKVLAPSIRAISFDLLPSLEIREALLHGDAPTAVDFVHGKGGSAILLPTPVRAGETVNVRIAYGGSGVLVDEGTDIYAVEARTNWYPNFGVFKDRATYDLRFSVPDDLAVVAVGREVSTAKEGGRLISHWTVERPITVAGFNYGDFQLFEEQEENTGMSLAVYASKGEPDIITEINRDLAAMSGSAGTDPRLLNEIARGGSTTFVDLRGGVPSSMSVSTTAIAELALADAINSVQILSAYFGPIAGKRLAMTQQSNWNFGQAWPSLVYLPYLMGISKMLQTDLGMEGYAGFYDEVGIHEIAHQWWGHEVGWASYRDQWLSEGFAEFSTALVVELTKGREAHRAFWNRRRAAILGRGASDGPPAYRVGSLDLGFRASTRAAPHAYSALAYSKGAFVLHMLRMQMRDHQSEQPDARFFAMMKDFVESHRGRNASTDDFKRMVEKHIVPELNATRNGKVDWFFDQWVHGTEIPILEAEVEIEKAGKGKYRLVGNVKQDSVPEGFLTLVGLYVEDNKGVIRQFGRMPFRGPTTRPVDVTLDLPKKPKRVLINAEYEVLAFDG